MMISSAQFFSLYAPILNMEERGILITLSMFYEANGNIALTEYEMKKLLGIKSTKRKRDPLKTVLGHFFRQDEDNKWHALSWADECRAINDIEEPTSEPVQEDTPIEHDTANDKVIEDSLPEGVKHFEELKDVDDTSLFLPPKSFNMLFFGDFAEELHFLRRNVSAVFRKMDEHWQKEENRRKAKTLDEWLFVFFTGLQKFAGEYDKDNYNSISWLDKHRELRQYELMSFKQKVKSGKYSYPTMINN